MLGKLEEEVLLASLQAGQDALPTDIYSRYEIASGNTKITAFGAVYTTLHRMVAKGFLVEKPRTDPLGRNRRGFTITASGRDALSESMNRIRRLGGFALAGDF